VSGNIYFVTYNWNNVVMTNCFYQLWCWWLFSRSAYRLTGNHYRQFLSHEVPKLLKYVGSGVLTAVVMKSIIFWDITTCSPLKVPPKRRLTFKRTAWHYIPEDSTLLEDVPLAVIARMCCMHDGAPAYFSRAVRNVFNKQLSWPMESQRRTHCMPSTLTRFESSGFLPVGTRKTSCVCAPVDNEKALHHRNVDACHDYPQLPRHLWTDTAIHTETCRGLYWISWRAFWPLTINALFQL
jgi:hypothetical protein